MSAATEQNNGDVAVEKVAAAAADIVDAAVIKSAKEKSAVSAKSADNGTTKSSTKRYVPGPDSPNFDRDSSEENENTAANPTSPVAAKAATKRPAEAKTADSKKAKKEKASEAAAADGESDEDEILEEITEGSDVESDEYDIPYDEDIECEDDDDENDDGSGSDDQA